MSNSAWLRRSDATTLWRWITAVSIWVLEFGRRLRKEERHFAIFQSTRLTSIQLKCLTANSRSSCARVARELFQDSTEPFARSFHDLAPKNVPTISIMPGMLQYERNLL